MPTSRRRARPDQPRSHPYRSLRGPGGALVALFTLTAASAVLVVATGLRLYGRLLDLEEGATTGLGEAAGAGRRYLWAQLALALALLFTVITGTLWQYRAACNQSALSDRRLGCSPTAIFWLLIFWVPMMPREQGYIAPISSLAEVWRTSLGVFRNLPILDYRRISATPVWLAWVSLLGGVFGWGLGFGWYTGYEEWAGPVGNRSGLESALVFQVLSMLALGTGTGVGAYVVLQITRCQHAIWRRRGDQGSAARTWADAVNE